MPVSDVDGDSLTFNMIDAPVNGEWSIMGTDPLIIGYQPDANYFGTDFFTYTVSDGTYVSDIGTITIDIPS